MTICEVMASLKNREIFFLHLLNFNTQLLLEGKRRNLAADMHLFYEILNVRRKAEICPSNFFVRHRAK